MGTRDAALMLGVSAETVRKHLKSGRLVGTRLSPRRWQVETASVHRLLAKFGPKVAPADHTAVLAERITRLEDVVDRLQRDSGLSTASPESLIRERDKFRADAVTMRSAALQLNVAAREMSALARQTLTALDLQTNVVSELLGPSSPQDIIDNSA